MIAFPLRMLRWLVPALVLGARLIAADQTPAAATAPEPEPHLRSELRGLCDKLQPLIAGKSCLITPFLDASQGKSAGVGSGYLAEVELRDALVARKVVLADDAPMRAKLEHADTGKDAGKKAAPLQYTAKVITDLAKLCACDLVLLGRTQLTDKAAVDVYLYDGSNGKRLGQWHLALAAADFSDATLVPALNRKLLAWAEARIGQKVGRGECWDLAALGLEGIGARPANMTDFGTQLKAGQPPLPGDIIQFENAAINGMVIQHHTILVRSVGEHGRIESLEQNWMGGAEAGRVVAAKHYYDLTTHTGGVVAIWRPLPMDGAAK